jgi:hypothetical protein
MESFDMMLGTEILQGTPAKRYEQRLEIPGVKRCLRDCLKNPVSVRRTYVTSNDGMKCQAHLARP